MKDEALELMHMARAVLWGERDGGGDSRELSVALTNLDIGAWIGRIRNSDEHI
jgi:hypothetical protein